MSKFKEPRFAKDELDSKKTNIYVGYSDGNLLPGYDFKNKPFAKKGWVSAIEKLNGTSKKRECHEKINSFGYARWDKKSISFGVKFASHSSLGPSKIGKIALQKYNQLLGYLLEQAGWKNVQVSNGEYVVPLNNQENIKLLYTLSPSIGFYYKTGLPSMEDIENLEYDIQIKEKGNNIKKAGRNSR